MKHFPRRTIGPALEPLSLAEALVHLRLHETEETESLDYVAALIATARADAENRTERTLMPSTWVLKLDAFPSACGGLIELLHPPIADVTSVQYLDAAGATQTVNPAEYAVDTASEPGRLLPLVAWPATAARPGAVTVTYTAGYPSAAAVPMPIKQWMLLAMGDMHENRAGTNIGNLTTRLEFFDSLLAPYRQLGI